MMSKFDGVEYKIFKRMRFIRATLCGIVSISIPGIITKNTNILPSGTSFKISMRIKKDLYDNSIS
jgi:hypothetical protein